MKRFTAAPLITIGIFGGAFAQWWVILLFARRFGTGSVGEYATLSAIATPVFVIAHLGLREIYLTLVPAMSRRSFVLLRLAGVLIGCSALLGAGLLAGASMILAFAVAAQKTGEALLDLRYAVIQRALRMHRLGLLMTLNAGLTLAVTTGLALVGCSMEVTVAGAGLVSIGIAGVDALAVRIPPDPSVSATIGTVLTASVPVTLAQSILSLASYAPTWIVMGFGTTAQVGVFSSAAFLVVFANIVGATAQTILLPQFARLHAAGQGLMGAARNSFLSLAGVAGAGVGVAVVFGPECLARIYGPEFRLGHDDLLPIALAAALVIPAYVLNALLLVLNEYRSGAAIAAGALLATLVVGAVLGPSGASGVGAAAWAAFAGSVARLGMSLGLVKNRFQSATAARGPSGGLARK